MNIIALTGKKRHGKDSAAKIIQKYSTTRCVTLSFAKPIKEALSIIHCIPLKYFDDDDLKEAIIPEWNRTPRELAQWLGTEVYRMQFDNDTWLKNMKMRMDSYYQTNQDVLFIITDCRFNNEAEFIRNLGGTIWKVDANVRVPPSGDSHASERGIDDDYVSDFLDNNGSIDMLDEQIKMLMNC